MADESRAKPTAGPSADLREEDIFDTGTKLLFGLIKALRKAEEGADKPRVPPPFNPATAGGKWPDGRFEGDAAQPPPAVRSPDYDREPGCDCPRSELEIGGRGHLIDCERESKIAVRSTMDRK